MKKTKKIIAILVIALILLCSFARIVNAADDENKFGVTNELLKKVIEAKEMTSTKFSPVFLLKVYATDSLLNEPELSKILVENFTEKDLDKEGIIPMSFETEERKGDIDHNDASFLLTLADDTSNEFNNKSEDIPFYINAMKQDIIKKHNITSEGLEIRTTIEVPKTFFDSISAHYDLNLEGIKIFGGKSNSIMLSSKTTTPEQIEQMWEDLGKFVQGFDKDTEDDLEDAIAEGKKYITISAQVEAQVGKDAITYTLTLGNDQNWYLVPDKLPEEKEFSTEISYKALINGKDVGQNTKYKEKWKIDSSVFCPGFDEKQPAKDADVTVTIKSKTDLPILKTNDVALTDDGKTNSEGWYYVDTKDKKVIAKLYKFDDYNNLQDNGIVKKTKLSLTSEDNLTDEQKVAITWPFRIIDVKYDPTEITEKTDKVTVTITTNLPMDKDKVPAGWAFTTDVEGKTQHRIFKIYEKKGGKNIDETITVKQNGTDITDNAPVKITWKEELPEKHPQTGGTVFATTAIATLSMIGIVAFKKYRK